MAILYENEIDGRRITTVDRMLSGIANTHYECVGVDDIEQRVDRGEFVSWCNRRQIDITLYYQRML